MNGAREANAGSDTLLAVDKLTMRFGGVTALSDVCFAVARGSITGLIGPNGAGKTTCFNCITRVYRPTSGAIAYGAQNLLGVAPHAVAGHRIARTFQNVALFGHMTVLENVLVGYHARFGGPEKKSERDALAEAERVLTYLDLTSVAHRRANGLPYGTRKSVELARALVASPELLLLDEPAAGLNHEEVALLGQTISKVRADFGATILMVEHHMGLVMGISEHVVVLDSGRKLADGSPQTVQRDPAVIEAYLGAA